MTPSSLSALTRGGVNTAGWDSLDVAGQVARMAAAGFTSLPDRQVREERFVPVWMRGVWIDVSVKNEPWSLGTYPRAPLLNCFVPSWVALLCGVRSFLFNAGHADLRSRAGDLRVALQREGYDRGIELMLQDRANAASTAPAIREAWGAIWSLTASARAWPMVRFVFDGYRPNTDEKKRLIQLLEREWST
jgi:hypothetical protein